MGRRKKKEVEEVIEEPVVETPEVVEEPKAEKPVAKKKAAKSTRIEAENVKKRPAVSVENMIEENEKHTIATDYQKYLRKLMKQAGGKA